MRTEPSPYFTTVSSSASRLASDDATNPRTGRWKAVATASRAPSIRAAAFVVLALACSAIASNRPLQIRQRPYDPAAQLESVEVEANTDSHSRGDDERVERAVRIGGNPVAAHVRAHEPARIDQEVDAQ